MAMYRRHVTDQCLSLGKVQAPVGLQLGAWWELAGSKDSGLKEGIRGSLGHGGFTLPGCRGPQVCVCISPWLSCGDVVLTTNPRGTLAKTIPVT